MNIYEPKVVLTEEEQKELKESKFFTEDHVDITDRVAKGRTISSGYSYC